MDKKSVILTVIVVLALIVVGLSVVLYWDVIFPEDEGKTTKQQVDTNEAPIAKLSVSATTVHVDDIVTFDGNSSEDPDGEIDFYIWDFGDGITQESPNASYVEHIYSYGGDYLVNFTVQDNADNPKRNSTHVVIHVIPRDYADSGTMWVIARDETFNNQSTSFPVEDEAIKVNISLTLRGMSIDGGLESADFEVFVYNPYSVLMDSEEITVTGSDTVTFDFEAKDLKVSGDYMLEVACSTGGGLISYEIEVLYQ
jgi:hypothetical protein